MNTLRLHARTAAQRSVTDAFSALAEDRDRCVFFKDTAGRYALVNQAFCRWLDRSEGEILGRTVIDIWPAAVADSLAADNRRVLAGERVEHEEQRPNGSELRTLWTVKMPVKDAHGQIIGVLGYFADVTDGQHRDSRGHRRAVVGRLTSGLAHDLDQLLTLAHGNAALLASGVPEDAPEHALAERVESAVARAADLTRRLMVFACEDDQALQPAQINDAVAEVTNLFRAVLDRRISLEVKPGADLPRVLAPLSQLTQVVLNLCLNARDAMPDGGRLTVQTDLVRVVTGKEAAVAGTDGRPTGRVRLRVTDTGTGMTSETQASVAYHPWYSTRSDGQGGGMGLAIVQDVVRRNGGWVECTSTVGQGTCFAVFFPVEATKKITAPATVPDEANDRTSVLVVDNDGGIVFLCRKILEMNGYRVDTALKGRDGAELFRRESARFAVVILDQNMPEMRGRDLLAELAAIDPGVRVLFMSGAPLEEMPAEFGRNVRGFLSKPFHAVDLVAAVRDALADA